MRKTLNWAQLCKLNLSNWLFMASLKVHSSRKLSNLAKTLVWTTSTLATWIKSISSLLLSRFISNTPTNLPKFCSKRKDTELIALSRMSFRKYPSQTKFNRIRSTISWIRRWKLWVKEPARMVCLQWTQQTTTSTCRRHAQQEEYSALSQALIHPAIMLSHSILSRSMTSGLKSRRCTTLSAFPTKAAWKCIPASWTCFMEQSVVMEAEVMITARDVSIQFRLRKLTLNSPSSRLLVKTTVAQSILIRFWVVRKQGQT